MRNRFSMFASALCLTAAVAAIPVASAQDWTTYHTVVNKKDFEIDWGSFYKTAEAKTMEVRKQLRHELDVPYGKDIKQRMDLYFPTAKTTNAPVLVFLHGGGFREGDRKQYGYVGEPFAKHGIITVVASYRLTPAFRHPAQPGDAKAIVGWIHKNIAKYGGDPNAIYVSGHSAGAILAADIGVDVSWMDALKVPRTALRGIVPISGSYDLRGSKRLEYLPTPEAEEKASALLHVNAPAPVAIVAYGSQEERLKEPSAKLVQAITAKGAKAKTLNLEGKDHATAIWEFSEENSVLTQAVLAMIKSGSSKP